MNRPLAIGIVLGICFVSHGLTAEPTPALVSPPFDATRAANLRAEWAAELSLHADFKNSLGMTLRLIPGGRFDMGVNGSKHRVTLTKPYYLGETEVTLGQYRAWKPGHRIEGAGEPFNRDDVPAVLVSWHDARAFCAWLSARPEERNGGRLYTLPTEAQWEWAARAGTTANSFFGDVERDRTLEARRVEYAWYNHTYTPNPPHESEGRGRQPVARLKPNAWGLFDVYGNVWEWCDDRRGDDVTGETRDPVIRGGGWRSGGFHCTSVAYEPADPNTKNDHTGFRVACRIVRSTK